jgi:hypothetical protein
MFHVKRPPAPVVESVAPSLLRSRFIHSSARTGGLSSPGSFLRTASRLRKASHLAADLPHPARTVRRRHPARPPTPILPASEFSIPAPSAPSSALPASPAPRVCPPRTSAPPLLVFIADCLHCGLSNRSPSTRSCFTAARPTSPHPRRSSAQPGSPRSTPETLRLRLRAASTPPTRADHSAPSTRAPPPITSLPRPSPCSEPSTCPVTDPRRPGATPSDGTRWSGYLGLLVLRSTALGRAQTRRTYSRRPSLASDGP